MIALIFDKEKASNISILNSMLVNLWNFLLKCFDLISLTSQQGILMHMKVFLISHKLGEILKHSSIRPLPFWNSLSTLSMKPNGQSAFINFSITRWISSLKFEEILFGLWTLLLITDLAIFTLLKLNHTVNENVMDNQPSLTFF